MRSAMKSDRFDYSTKAFSCRIAELEVQHAKQIKPADLILVTGDSDITYWSTLEEDLLPWNAWNCGFGGATTRQVAYYADRLILPHRPSRVILNAGDNDLGKGATPEEVVGDTDWFVSKLLEAVPDVRIFIMSLKRTELREPFWKKIQETNRRLGEYAHGDQRLRFVNVTTVMLHPDQSVRTDLYRDDRLHLNEAGYRVFAGVIRQALAGEEG